MTEGSRSLIFRKRNVLGLALVAGIGLGIYLGQFKGFGLGGTGSFGIGSSGSESQSSLGSAKTKTSSRDTQDDVDEDEGKLPSSVPNVVRVVIDDRRYLLRSANKDVEITLPKLINLIKQAPGDNDGIRLRIYQKATMRMSTEEALKEALVAAGIPDTAILSFHLPSNSGAP